MKKKKKKKNSPIENCLRKSQICTLSSKSNTHRGKSYLAFFKAAFGFFLRFSGLNLAFSSHWHLATLPACTTLNRAQGFCLFFRLPSTHLE
jgi:hypothetical protein